VNGPRVVVVMGGGGAKAAAHLGAAAALRKAGIVPTHWVGTSMGSVVAAALAGGADPEALLAEFAQVREQDVLRREPFALLKGIWAPAIFRSDTFRATLERLIVPRRFGELATPCTVTAVERDTGQVIAFGTGGEDAPLLDVLAASCALPPWFRPVRVNGREFYDGGIRAPLPLPVAESLACDVVLAIDVGPGFDELGQPLRRPPPFVAATDTAIGWLMAGTTELLRQRWAATPGLPRLVYVRPTHDRGATFAIEQIAEYGRMGAAAVHQVIGELS
jgi:predicted acylesterase/phospholipase RssA